MLRALGRAAVYLALTFVLMPVQAVAVALRARLAERLPGIYHRMCARIFGFDIVVRGQVTDERPVLFVGNHTSYLDILVIGAVIDGSFVAKAEVADWPLFGWLAKLQRTVFIERRGARAADQRTELESRLAAGDRLILFPEGTSDDGNRVLPFKSALFSVAEHRADGRALTVQPFSIAYTRLDGLPVGREWRSLFAWYGNVALGPHAWRVIKLGRVQAELWFHDPVTIDPYKTRKALAEHCHEVVAAGLAAANRGAPALPGSTAAL